LEKVTIIYPAIAMFMLTLSMIFALGISRFIAIQRKEISVRYFQQYKGEEQPERLYLLSRHVQHHFEVPPLFHVSVILIYVTDSVSIVSITAAWLFVALRCVHSYIHLGKNNVKHRFYSFAFSLIALAVLWASLFFSVLTKA